MGVRPDGGPDEVGGRPFGRGGHGLRIGFGVLVQAVQEDADQRFLVREMVEQPSFGTPARASTESRNLPPKASGAPVAVIAFGAFMGWAFVRRQKRLASPLLDLSLFSNPVFSTAITANVLALFSYNGFILFLAQHLQLLEGTSPSASGMAMLPALAAW